ncbi:7tm Chemosensory receptor [Popillia japonica]|uniref:7tm Chemosensory receptor n=1 Tax=Popillia japonica TaxID=7064 RepID=A0AAW1JYI5_POPJA
MLFDAVLWYLATDNKFHFYMLYENLQKYQTHILVQLMVNLILSLKHRYRIANDLLAETVKQRDVVSVSSSKVFFRPYKDIYTVKNVIKIFIGLNKMVEHFNKIYGWTLLCIHINIIASLLVSLDFIIEFKSDTNTLKDQYGLEFILLMSMWSLMALGLGILLASIANSTINEAQNTSNAFRDISTVSPKKDFPVPKASRKPSNDNRKRGKAAVITSSPYKSELQKNLKKSPVIKRLKQNEKGKNEKSVVQKAAAKRKLVLKSPIVDSDTSDEFTYFNKYFIF